jgi:hypothetical protein
MLDVSDPNPSQGGLLKIESAFAVSKAALIDYCFVPSSLLKLIEGATLLTY